MCKMRVLGIWASIALAWCATSQADEKQPELLRSILQEWESRQQQVQSLECTADVDSFYPRGYLSEKWNPSRQDAGKPPSSDLPEQDKRITGEPFACKIDFASKSIRRETTLSTLFMTDDVCELRSAYQLQLFENGKFRQFNRQDKATRSRDDSVIHPDVTLYESASHSFFLLSLCDLPLLWLAGGVNGKYPAPENMQLLEGVDRWAYRGEAKWGEHDCVVLTTQEQNSPTSVREFWVGRERPFPIYSCRMRDGDVVYRNLTSAIRRRADSNFRRVGFIQSIIPMESYSKRVPIPCAN